MTKVAIAVVLVACSITVAHASNPGTIKAQPARIRVADVERSVQGLAQLRHTPAFDNCFKDAVNLIKKLHAEGTETDRVDAEDLALSALHYYMDHNQIRTRGDDVSREATTKKAAANIGLLAVLGW